MERIKRLFSLLFILIFVTFLSSCGFNNSKTDVTTTSKQGSNNKTTEEDTELNEHWSQKISINDYLDRIFNIRIDLVNGDPTLILTNIATKKTIEFYDVELAIDIYNYQANQTTYNFCKMVISSDGTASLTSAALYNIYQESGGRIVARFNTDSTQGYFRYKECENHYFVRTEVLPTCTDEGYIIHECEYCFYYSKTPNGSPLGHDYVEMAGTKRNPTCEEEGYVLERCSRCGKTNDHILEPLGHYNANGYCPRCGWLNSEKLVLNAKAFNGYNDENIIIPKPKGNTKISGINLTGYISPTGYLCENLYFGGTLNEYISLQITYSDDYHTFLCKNLYLHDDNGDTLYQGEKYSLVTTVEISNTVLALNPYIFAGNESIDTLVLSTSVENIKDGAFYMMKNLKNVYYNGSIDNWCDITFVSLASNPLIYTKKLYILDEDGTINYGSNKYSVLKKVNPSRATAINNYAFYGLDCLEEVTLPSTVTSIGVSSFYKCTGLKEITIPAKVKTIYKSAFEECTSLESIIFEDNSNLSTLFNRAFAKCTSLKTIALPSTITVMGSEILAGDSALESIEFPGKELVLGELFGNELMDSKPVRQFTLTSGPGDFTLPKNLNLVTINGGTVIENMFMNCGEIANIVITGNVKNIEYNAFQNNNDSTIYFDGEFSKWMTISTSLNLSSEQTALLRISDEDGDVELNNKKYKKINSGVITISDGTKTIPSRAFANFDKVTDIILPDSLIEIGSEAFTGCLSLTKITLPSSINTISSGMFFGCTNLEEVETAGYINKVGESTFEGCVNLSKINFGENLDEIGKRAFKGCESLKNITLGYSVYTIGDYAFQDMTSLEVVTIPYTVDGMGTGIGKGIFTGCSNLKEITLGYLGKGVSETKTLGYYFEYVEDTENFTETIQNNVRYYLPNSLEKVTVISGGIIASAFENCNNIKEISVTDGLLGIPSYAFFNCESLTTLSIGDSYRTVGDYAFSGCKKLMISINNTVTQIGEGAYKDCLYLQSVDLSTYITQIKDHTFEGCINLAITTVPDAITKIGDYAFSGCKSMNSFTIPSGVKNIGSFAFKDCTRFQTFSFPQTVETIGEGALSGCYNITILSIPFVGYSIDNTYNINTLGFTFGTDRYDYSTPTDNPEGFSTIYYLPKKLTKVVVKGGNNVPDGAFAGCSTLETINLQFNFDKIGFYAFANCKSLKSVNMTNTYKIIGEYAFSGCESLQSFNFYNNLTNIGPYAFSGCKSLTKITTPQTVNIIPEGMFYNCLSLKTLIITDNITQINYNAFRNCYKLVEIYNQSSLSLVTGSYDNGSVALYAYDIYDDLSTPSKIHLYGDYSFYEASDNDIYLIEYFGSNRNVALPDTYKSKNYQINSGAFYGNQNITSIVIKEGVTGIKDNAFKDCYRLVQVTNLSSLNIEKGSTNYGEVAFYALVVNNTDLGDPMIVEEGDFIFYEGETDNYLIDYSGYDSNVVLPKSYKDSEYKVLRYAFYNKTQIRQITLPNTVRVYRGDVFNGCTSIIEVYYDGSIDDWCHTEFFNEYSNPMAFTDKFYILDENGEISFNGKNYTTISSVTIPTDITKLGSSLFMNIKTLENVILHDNITSIGSYTFSGCTSIKELIIPDSVKSLGIYAFAYMTAPVKFGLGSELTSFSISSMSNYKGDYVIIPAGVFSIADYAFYGCSFNRVYCLNTSLEYKSSVKIGVNGNYDLKNTPWFTYTLSGQNETRWGNWWYYNSDNEIVVL